MQFDISLFLIGLPIAFALGWLASRFDIRQIRIENEQAPKAYFKGLTFLLNEQQDQAIDAFIEAVQQDPNTSELHFALGDLFRRRGEYERAVRVHQHLLSRGDLSKDERDRAQYALAQDYFKAGIFDRAENALIKLEGTRFVSQAHLALMANYERSRDWQHALDIAKKIQHSGHSDFSVRMAHYLCEIAIRELAHQRLDKTLEALTEALKLAPQNGRPYIEIAKFHELKGNHDAAWGILMQGLIDAPLFVPLLVQYLINPTIACKKSELTLAKLREIYATNTSIDVIEAMVSIETLSGISESTPPEWYIRHLSHELSLNAAAKWLKQEKFANEQYHEPIQRAIDNAAAPFLRYRCAACGFEARQHFWQCPGCQNWDSYPPQRIEEI